MSKRTETSIFTNMCMIYDDNGNVVVQERVDPDWSGITFPGGHVEKNESFTDSVIREVYEETGLVVSKLQMCGIKDWINEDGTRYIVHCYKTNVFSGELRSSDEGRVFWTKLSELQNFKVVPDMMKMLKLFVEDTVTEFYFCKEAGEYKGLLK